MNDAAALAEAKRYAVDRSSRRTTEAAFEQLRGVEPEALTELVDSLIVSPDPADRALAVRLAPYLSQGGLPAIVAATEREKDSRILAAAAEALGEFQGPEASARLALLAANSDPAVRRAAAVSLYGRRDTAALAALITLIRDANHEVSGSAAWALADNFEPSEQRDLELERWLSRADQDSQLAGQIRTALAAPRTPTRGRRRATVPRDRTASKRRTLGVLVVSANPVDTTQLALDEEVRSLTASLRATPARNSVRLDSAWAMRPLDLLVELNEHKPDILHFSGHGMADSQLVFLDDEGNPKPVDGDALSSTLSTAGESVRVVVLNACFSAPLAESLTEHVDVAVGMDRPVGDEAARVFSRAFYSALGYGTSVGQAFEQARAALKLEGFSEHEITRLSSKPGIDPYEVFLVDSAAVRGEDSAADIEILQRVSANHLEHLAKHAVLPIGDGVEIVRSLGSVVRQRADRGSLFVVGAPGSGKSGAIYRLARDLASAGRDVVVLAADLLAASGRGGLKEELGINLDLVDLLGSWKGDESGFLIIDALDAARGREALTVLLGVIERIARREGRWRIVASVRTFDLRHNPDLQGAIPARAARSDEPYIDPEFAGVRHVAVGDLSNAELESLEDDAPEVHEFLTTASPRLRELLRVPFNLRLLSALLQRDQADQARLQTLETQLELFDLYWERRVLAPAIGRDAREQLAVDLCRTAIATMRLQVPRQALREAAAAHTPHFEELLSEGVLVEAHGSGRRSDTVGFAHHMLFDYAVHRLLLTGAPDDIAQQLTEPEELVLLARPSLVLTLVSEWEGDPSRGRFWDLVLRLAAPDVPTAARLVGPNLAAEHAVAPADISSLLLAIDRGHPEAPFVLRHVVGARAAAGLPTRPLAGAELEFWAELAVELSNRLTPDTAYPLRILVWGLSSESDRLSTDETAALGISARALLGWARNQAPPAQQDLQVAIEGAARSCASDPAATDALLSLALDRERVAAFGGIEVRPLAEEIPSLVRCIPDFVARLYETAFGYEEESEELTSPFGTGQILRLTSTRRQDWEMVRYALAQEYPAVLETNARAAIRALAAACIHEADRYSRNKELRFRTPLGDVSVLRDGSAYWGSAGYHRDIATMLDEFERTLAESGPEAARSIIGLLVEDTFPAAIWARVLRAATRAPDNLMSLVAGVPASADALMSSELRDPISELLRVGPLYWGEVAEEEVEDAIASLPERYPAEARGAAALRRDHFLMSIPAQAIQRPRIRELRAKAEAENPVGPPRDRLGMASWTASDDDYDFRARGIDPTDPASRDLLDAINPVSQFVSAHANAAPTLEQAREMVEPLVRLRELWQELRGQVAETLLDDAEAWLPEAAATLAQQTPLPVQEQNITLARELALAGAGGAIPRGDPDLEQFDSHALGWGVPSGRIDAARALLLLSREPRLATDDLFAAVEVLARDEHPAVRWVVARSLGLARQTNPEFVWQLIARMAEDEPSAQVLQALLESLSGFVDERLEGVAELVRGLYDREVGDRRNEALLRELTSFLVQLWVWRGHASGRRLVDEWVEEILPNAEVAQSTFFDLRRPVTHGTDSAEDRGIRLRALGIWADLTRAAGDAFHTVEHDLRSGEEPSPELRDQFGALVKLLDSSAAEVYFGSGAYAEKADREERLAPDVRRRFYREGGRVLDLLAPIGLPSIAHHLLETLASFVEMDPRGILLRVGKVLSEGRRWGYQFEGLAEQEFVRLVEVYLASHRDLLLGDRESRQVLLDSLDGFVEAGWPSARRLLYGLDDIFR